MEKLYGVKITFTFQANKRDIMMCKICKAHTEEIAGM